MAYHSIGFSYLTTIDAGKDNDIEFWEKYALFNSTLNCEPRKGADEMQEQYVQDLKAWTILNWINMQMC